MNELTERSLSGDSLEKRADTILSGIVADQLRAAGYASLLDTDGRTPEFQRSVVLALQAQTGLIRLSDLPPEGTSGLRLGPGAPDRPIHGIEGNAPSNTIAAYLIGLWLTIISRNSSIMEDMAWYPVDLTAAPTARFNKYMFLWAECWQALFRHRQVEVGRITAAMDATLRRNLEYPDEDYGTLIAYPAMNLLLHLVTRNTAEFNTTLEQALEDHAAFNSTPDRVATAHALVAWPLLAAVCQAADKGIPVEVESDYLPRALIDRDWAAPYEPIY
ncbi:immunity 49 family protein [Nocardia sp. NBC_01377]